MKYWIMCILRINPRLDAMSEKLTKEVKGKALCIAGETMNQINEIFDLNDKKIMLINLRVCYEWIMSVLSADDKYIIESYSQGCTLEEIGNEIGYSRTTVLRRLTKAITKAEIMLKAKGFNAEYFEEEYKDFLPVMNFMKKIKKQQQIRANAALESAKNRKALEAAKALNNNETSRHIQTGI